MYWFYTIDVRIHLAIGLIISLALLLWWIEAEKADLKGNEECDDGGGILV
jgi:hypothetical protein